MAPIRCPLIPRRPPRFINVRVLGTDGSEYYLQYRPVTGTPDADGSYAVIPIGTTYKNGFWHELNRSLDRDLRMVFPGVGVSQVPWFCVRGDLLLDDLTLWDNRMYYYAADTRMAERRMA